VRDAAAVCFVVSAVAEIVAALLLVRVARRARAALRNPEPLVLDGGGPEPSLEPAEHLPGVREALENQREGAPAVVLVFVGILAGTVGNFLTL